MIVQSKKEEFLQDKVNKQRFIHYLADKLERAGCSTDHTKQDADVFIVQTAVASARTKETVITGDDTDLLVLLLYRAEINTHDLFLASEPKQCSSKSKIWCIQQSKELLGIDVCDNIFIHAILGCETTSRLYELGKGLAPKKFKSNVLFCQQAGVFNSSWPVVKNDRGMAGEKALMCLYGGASDEGLNALRYKRFCEKVARSSLHHTWNHKPYLYFVKLCYFVVILQKKYKYIHPNNC